MNNNPRLELDRYIPALITFFANKMSVGASQIYAQLFQINVIEWRIISMLAVEPNISASRISQIIGLDKGAVSRAIAKLSAENYVKITPDQKDARATRISLTEEGLKLHDRVYKVAMDREQAIFNVLAEEDQEHLIRILNILNANIVETNELLNEKYLNKGSVHDKFHRILVLSGFFFLKIASTFLNSSFFPKPIKRRIAI